MRKKKLSILLGLCASFVVAGGSFLATTDAQAATLVRATSDLFLSSDVKSQSVYTPTETEYDAAGLYLRATEKNSVVTMKDELAGEFSLLCEPIISAGLSTVKSMSITFADVATKQSFDLQMEFGHTTQLSVEINGKQAGIVYVNGNQLGQTGIANTSGTYTDYASPLLPLGFNPETMQVCVGNGVDERVVWDLSKPKNDGYYIGETLDSFSTYTVTYTISNFVGEESGLVVYELNGYALDNLLFSEDNSAAPVIYTKAERLGLIGEKYKLPQALAYDVNDGLLSEVKAQVYAPDNTVVTLKNDYFTPRTEGTYFVRYTAENSFGKETVKELAIEVLAETPAYVFEFTEEAEIPETAWVGESLYVPHMTVRGGLTVNNVDTVKATVKCNNVALISATKRNSGFSYFLPQKGEYKIVYHLPSGDETYTVQVRERSENVYFDYAFASSYSVGEYIDVSTGKLYIEDVEQAFNVIVAYPDGNKYSNKKFVCDTAGKYELTVVSAADATKKTTRTFIVASRAQDIFVETENVSVGFGKSKVTQRDGVVLTTKESGASVWCKQTIDLTTYVNQSTEASNGLTVFGETKVALAENAKPLLDFSVEPYAYGVAATKQLYITLTDINDSNNKIRILLDRNNSTLYTYIRAAATGQEFVGVNDVNGEYVLQKNNYGRGVFNSFVGKTNTVSHHLSNNRVALYYDYTEKQLLVGGLSSTKCSIVADFDNPLMCGGETWAGFSTGEVQLSIEFLNIIGPDLSCTVYAVDGKACTQEYTKYGKPEINVKTSFIEGLKGNYVTLPEVEALDTLGAPVRTLITKVVYLAENGKEYDINVRDGKFVTDYVGEYAIRFNAIDVFGNEAVKEVRVNVYDTFEALYAEVQAPEEYKTAKTGDNVMLLDAEEVDVYNALGEVKASVAVTFDGKEVDLDEGVFVPKKAGTYTVTYTFTDGVGRTATTSYEVEVELVEELVVLSGVPVYVGMVEGYTYTLQDVYVIDYAAESPTETKADVYINGEKYTQSTYQPQKSEVEQADVEEIVKYVTIEYKYDGRPIDGLSYTLPVRNLYKKVKQTVGMMEVETEVFQINRYFLAGTGVRLALGTTALDITTLADEDAKAQFIQPIAADNFSISFDVPTRDKNYTVQDNNVKAFHINLVDSADVSKSVRISFVKETAGTVLYVNGEKMNANFMGSLDGTSQNVFNISLNAVSYELKDVVSGATLANFKTYTDGRRFSGFSKMLYVSCEVERESAEKGATMKLLSLNGQNFSSAVYKDEVAPTIAVKTDFESLYVVGDEVQSPTATATDVLNDISELTVTVTCNGSVIKDKNGLDLNKVSAKVVYDIPLSNVGEYKFNYEATDAQGSTVNVVYTIRVAVNDKPVLTLSGNVPTSGKVGQEITLPTFTVQYTVESENNMAYAMYIDSSNRYQYLDGNTFTPTAAGRYIVRYYALDLFGNYTLQEYEINVTK